MDNFCRWCGWCGPAALTFHQRRPRQDSDDCQLPDQFFVAVVWMMPLRGERHRCAAIRSVGWISPRQRRPGRYRK